MTKAKDQQPIVIPSAFAQDRAVHRLVTSWMHIHFRHHLCTKRQNWRLPNASATEKKRRREKWQCVARIMENERTLLRWLAKETQHPDIWQSSAPDAPESRRVRLHRAYYKNIVDATHASKMQRILLLQERARIVSRIRTLERTWMLALFHAVYPDKPPPNPIRLHPRELFPRKLKRASMQLAKELDLSR